MPLFMCSKCLVVDNTALGDYWQKPKAPLCSECSTGTWHDQFGRTPAVGWVLTSEGYLYSQEEIPRHRPRFERQKITILGIIGIHGDVVAHTELEEP